MSKTTKIFTFSFQQQRSLVDLWLNNTQGPQIGTNDIEKVEIEILDVIDRVNLLLTHVGLQGSVGPDRIAAEEISELVGGVPLVIATIGGFTKQAELPLD